MSLEMIVAAAAVVVIILAAALTFPQYLPCRALDTYHLTLSVYSVVYRVRRGRPVGFKPPTCARRTRMLSQDLKVLSMSSCTYAQCLGNACVGCVLEPHFSS